MSTRDKYLSILKTFDAPELALVASPIDHGVIDMPFLKTMRKVCSFAEIGVGLAAPQIGVMKRAIFVWPGRAGMGQFMLNPEIVSRSNVAVRLQEGCLSYPGIFIDLWRSESIRVTFWDERWKKHDRQFFDGMEARIILHEIDHLDGVCRVGEEWRKRFSTRCSHTLIEDGVCQMCGSECGGGA